MIKILKVNIVENARVGMTQDQGVEVLRVDAVIALRDYEVHTEEAQTAREPWSPEEVAANVPAHPGEPLLHLVSIS